VVPNISDLSTGQKAQVFLGVDERASCNLFMEVDPVSTASITWRGRISTTAGSLDLNGSAGTQTHYLLVEDIGPSAAPA
jgi:hypothetical protein